MGGSRRKVTTKQYFEQKKRQQQTAGLYNTAEGTNAYNEYHENPKSLDILSLLNLAKVAQECRSNCTNGYAFQELSVLDLLGDDGPNTKSERSTVHEAHVAFSVEGLGKIGMETPAHSPRQLGRISCNGLSSPSKAARRHRTSKNFKNFMDDFELEVNSMVHGADIPRCDTNNQSAKMKHSTLIGFMALDGDDYAVDNFFSEEASLYDNAEDNEKPLDARSSFLHDFSSDEETYDVAWERRPHNKTSHFTDSWRCKTQNASDFAFEDSYLQSKRRIVIAPNEFDFSAVPYFETSGKDQDFMATTGARNLKEEGSWDFSPLSWSYFTKRDTKDNISMLRTFMEPDNVVTEFPSPNLYPNTHFSYKRSKLDSPVKYARSENFFNEQSASECPLSPVHSCVSPIVSNIGFRPENPDIFQASRSEDKPSDSSEVLGSKGDVETVVKSSRYFQEKVVNSGEGQSDQATGCEKFAEGSEKEGSVGNSDLLSDNGKTVNSPGSKDNCGQCMERKDENSVLIEMPETQVSVEHKEENSTKDVLDIEISVDDTSECMETKDENSVLIEMPETQVCSEHEEGICTEEDLVKLKSYINDDRYQFGAQVPFPSESGSKGISFLFYS
ncbi:hypothetical protein GIB67_041111 [Kingdonia uniflora]|uniref:Uncharacterized protein n=1 Tax=Kingdonia uniflora TaxID=39325 RepID=A0A7J7LK87_9MAGN|nr:hypothetical protein GIB67_041111 [Kingdonia uniflora]